MHGGLVQVHGSWIVTLSIALYRHCLLKSNSFCHSKGSVLLFFSVGGKSYFFRVSPWFFVSIKKEWRRLNVAKKASFLVIGCILMPCCDKDMTSQ